jgi:hypothetical protein
MRAGRCVRSAQRSVSRSSVVARPAPGASSRSEAAAAEDVHDEVADGDDYACDSIDDSDEYLHAGRV